jgi:hypothetical protein
MVRFPEMYRLAVKLDREGFFLHIFSVLLDLVFFRRYPLRVFLEVSYLGYAYDLLLTSRLKLV